MPSHSIDPKRIRRSACCWLTVFVALLVCQSGCLQRRMLLRSNPPGALVYINGKEIGTTPIETHFIYYGAYEIKLVKDGYETETVMQPVQMPWYQVPPLDFISENLVPGEIRDHRVLSFNLRPQVQVPTEQLIWRAGELRQTSHAIPGPAVEPEGLPGPTVLPEGSTDQAPEQSAEPAEQLPAPQLSAPLLPLMPPAFRPLSKPSRPSLPHWPSQ